MKTIKNMREPENDWYFDLIQFEKGDIGRDAGNGFKFRRFKDKEFAIRYSRNTSDAPMNYKVISEKTKEKLEAMTYEEYIIEAQNICF